jgi:hypothetical protein
MRKMVTSLSLVLLLLAVSLSVVSGKPYFLVASPRPYCIQVEAPEETLLKVHYEAPGKLGKDCICCLIS